MEIIEINTPTIKLDQAIKKASWVGSGVEAKMIIQDGQVLLNDEVCLMRGKQLKDGDVVRWEGETFQIKEVE